MQPYLIWAKGTVSIGKLGVDTLAGALAGTAAGYALPLMCPAQAAVTIAPAGVAVSALASFVNNTYFRGR